MKFHLALNEVVRMEGKSVLNELRLVNILNDLQAFQENPSSKYILTSLIKDGYTKVLLGFDNWGIEAHQLTKKIIDSTGFSRDIVEKILTSIAYALGLVANVDMMAPVAQAVHTSGKLTYSSKETYQKSLRFVIDIYEFIINLSNDKSVNKHMNDLYGVQVSSSFTGDADTSTFRGKLFLLLLIDIYRTLDKFDLDLKVFSPDKYPLALFVVKLYARLNLQYEQVNLSEETYHNFCKMINPTYESIETPEEFFHIYHELCDYEGENYSEKYLKLMSDMIGIIVGAIEPSDKKYHIDSFLGELKALKLIS